MAGIRIVNTFDVETDIGKCSIQLCIGDITALPKREEVDVLVLSAFPGDCSPTPSSLIGQLLLKLGISVSALAKDKEEDLRSLYSCWWSKPLPNRFSFRKILCFEGGGKPGSKVGQVVGDVFRCLVPILANNEGKVIMPILASGDQRNSKTRMLRLLVNAAIHWMQTGLPLRSLKIVIFSRKIENISEADQPLLNLFQDLKDNHKKEENQEYMEGKKKTDVESYKYDICLSYSERDKKCVEQVVNVLVKNKSDIRIFSSIQNLDLETSWQAQLYDVIKNCKHVMTLITPSFLQSARCTEQYNIALCLSRKTRQSVLVPLYVFEVEYMPTYMKITQYVDCRFSFHEKLDAACITITSTLSSKPLDVATHNGKDTSGTLNLTSNHSYDVFLSYSHCNSEYAMQFMKEIRIKKPDLDVFIDTDELKAGGAWQLTLYNALERSKFVIALISKDYLHSKVCIEEFCLSIVLQLQNSCKIWPLVIEPLEENIEWLDTLSPVNCHKSSEGERNTDMSLVCNEILAALEGNPNVSLSETTNEKSLRCCLEEARSLFSEKDFVSLVNGAPVDMSLSENVSTSTFLPKDTSCDVDIYIICSSEDDESCLLLQKIITSEMESLIVKISTNEHTSTRLTYLDKARLVIPLLSSSFMQSPDLVHELNIAWCRQRDCSNLCFLVIVLTQLPKSPTYVSLFPCFFNCEDELWTKHTGSLRLFSEAELTRTYQNCHCPLNVILCFLTAVFQLQKWFNGEQCTVLGVHKKLVNVLHLKKCIQRYKLQMVTKHDEKVENKVAVDSSTSSKKSTDELSEACGEIVCKEQDRSLKLTEHGYVVEKNEAQSSPQEVNTTEERSSALVQTTELLAAEPLVEDKEQGNANIVLHGSHVFHRKTQDEIKTFDHNVRHSQGLTARNKLSSSACKII